MVFIIIAVLFLFYRLLDHVFQHFFGVVVEGVGGLMIFTKALRSEMLKKAGEQPKTV